MEKVMEVTEVKLAVLESFPPKLQINVSGTVPTGGWSNPKLKPYIFIQPPPDGIYDFDFVADPPDGPATQVISPIHADYLWNSFPENVKGVRVHAAQNSKTAMLNGSGHPDRQPTRFTFSDAEDVKRVVFFPKGGGPWEEGESLTEPQLEYNGPEGQVIFRGEEITQQKTVLGSLISVTLRTNIADEGNLDFALVMPPIDMGGETRQEFKTVGVWVYGLGFAPDWTGAQLRYEVLNLKGVAE